MKVAIFHNLGSGGAKRALYDSVRFLTKSDHTVEVFVPSTADESYLPLKDVVRELLLVLRVPYESYRSTLHVICQAEQDFE